MTRHTEPAMSADLFGESISGRVIPAITLWQPWACLIEIGAKTFETRSKAPPRRLLGQRIAIHAAARKQRKTDIDEETFDAFCDAFGGHHWFHMLPLGVVVCTAVLAAAFPSERVPHDAFGDYSPGRWAWRLDDVRPVKPHPGKGYADLGLALACARWGGVVSKSVEPAMSVRLHKADWEVRPVCLEFAQRVVAVHHYARGGSNTATYLHGLFRAGEIFDEQCQGLAWWIPPTRSAAEATFPERWQGVLCLSRLVILPGVPGNACTFLLARSRRLIDRKAWPCLVTYADEWQGHTGAIYRADNWTYHGLTRPERIYRIGERMVARKAGGHTRTHAEMLALGAEMIGAFAKHKFVRCCA